MTPALKAMDTRWKGFRFRSRTEARWAVFLEAAGICFDYEPEGYLLPSGPYLPDFRLNLVIPLHPNGERSITIFLEVKGDLPTDNEVLRASELARLVKSDLNIAPVFIAAGAPSTDFNLHWVNDNSPTLLTACRFVSNAGGGLSIEEEDFPGCAGLLGCRSSNELTLMREDPGAFNPVPPTFPPWLRQAYDRARAARFEFGQADQRWPA